MGAIGVLVAVVLLASPALARQKVGSIEKLMGKVYVAHYPERRYRKAHEKEPLYLNDRIKTGPASKALIRLIDGSEVHLAEVSRIKLTRFFLKEQKRQAEVDLLSGTLRAVVSKTKGTFSVNTPNSIAGVKGTDFVVTTKRRASFYFVNTGKVGVEGASSGVLLSKRTMTENYRGRKPILPVSLKENPDLEAALLKAMEMTSLEVPPVIKESALFEEILARWNINYAHYLADSGRYYEAETALKIAHALTARDYVRSEILMRIANIYSRYFQRPEESVKYYKELIEQYPDSVYYEMALYNLALSLYEIGKKQEAQRFFERYLQEFPEGRFRHGVEYYLKNK